MCEKRNEFLMCYDQLDFLEACQHTVSTSQIATPLDLQTGVRGCERGGLCDYQTVEVGPPKWGFESPKLNRKKPQILLK